MLNVAKRAHDQCTIFSMVHPDYGLLLELHVLTPVTRSYVLLTVAMHAVYVAIVTLQF